jgi:hypothetical protein
MKLKFGKLKSAYLEKMLESYKNDDKKTLKELMNKIYENKDFRELYLLYEDIENKEIKDKEVAEYYVNELSKFLKEKRSNLTKIKESLIDEIHEYNDVYKNLDTLSEEDSIFNIQEKFTAKKNLIEHLMKEKNKEEKLIESYTQNEKLLASILTNNFNVLYNSTMNENEKEKLKEILSLTTEDITNKIVEIKNEVLNKVEKLLSESVNTELTEKLNTVRNEVLNTSPSRFNYYKLLELKNGLG